MIFFFKACDISIHTFLAEGDCIGYPKRRKRRISIHTFLAEGDIQGSRDYICKLNFNPHLPCGRRHVLHEVLTLMTNFNPHLPCGRRRRSRGDQEDSRVFQSTPSLRKATKVHAGISKKPGISIHTFLAEGDGNIKRDWIILSISIHTFLAEGDYRSASNRAQTAISIHTFLAEGDGMNSYRADASVGFQSTPSLRKATVSCTGIGKAFEISIHTFLAEGDMEDTQSRSL